MTYNLSIFRFQFSPPSARHYNSALSIWLSVDPMADKYPSTSPYTYCANNPVKLVDPNGEDPIYGRVGETISKIGDDGKNDGNSYLVLGLIASQVRAATANNNSPYTGDLSPSDHVLLIPTGGVLNDVERTVDYVHQSGNTVDERVEYGGHSIAGENYAHIWDKGDPVKIEERGMYTKKTWSITPFKINGSFHKQLTPSASNIIHIWHVQPENAIPSDRDKKYLSDWRSTGYKGTPFVIGEQSRSVSFYNGERDIITISYDVFLKMGRREDF